MQVQNFPIETQIGTFEDEKDVIDWMLEQDDSQVLAIDYITFINHLPLIQHEYLMRFNLLKNLNIQSYGNVLDDLPATWVDALNIMESEYNKAVKCRGNQKT